MYEEGDGWDDDIKEGHSTLESWFEYNAALVAAGKIDDPSRRYTYPEFAEKHIYRRAERKWIKADKNYKRVGRMHYASPQEGERFYLAQCLQRIPGATCFDDLKLIPRGPDKLPEVAKDFEEVVRKRWPHLLLDDEIHHQALQEADAAGQKHYAIRRLFAYLIVHGEVARKLELYQKNKHLLFFEKHETEADGLHDIADRLHAIDGSTLAAHGLPEPQAPRKEKKSQTAVLRASREYKTATTYDASEQDAIFNEAFKVATAEQREVLEHIREAVDGIEGRERIIAIDAPAGTGKTWIAKAALACVRGRNKIALATAYTGLASTLLPGGRTNHKCFLFTDFDKIRMRMGSSYVSNFDLQPEDLESQPTPTKEARQLRNARLQLLHDADVLLWDEISMASSYHIDLVNEICRDIETDPEKRKLPFGGKVRMKTR